MFLSHPNVELKLSGTARQGVHTRAGVLQALKDFSPAEPAQPGRIRLYPRVAQAVKGAMEEADHLTAAGLPVASRDNLSITFETPTGAIPLEEHLPAPTEAGSLRPQSLALDALESLKLSFCTPQALCLTTLTHRLADPEGTAAVAGMRVIRGGSPCSPERPQAQNANEAAPERPL